MEKMTLVDLKLNKKKLGNGTYSYYLSAEYNRETDDAIYRVTVPHVDLPVIDYGFDYYISPIEFEPEWIDFGFGRLNFVARDGGIIETKIKDKPARKMTVAEIEKKLGYKVEIVSEK